MENKQDIYSKYALELYTIFAPLAMRLPSLRDDPKLMKERIKAKGENGVSDVVTGVDIYMQQKIKDTVLALHPDWQFWGEEENDNISHYEKNKQYLVIVDPIEGTNNFIAKFDDNWGSVIALVDIETKEPVVGIVAHPAKRIFYFGIKGRGAYVLAYNEKNELMITNKMNPLPIFGYEDFTYNASPHFDKALLQQVKKFQAQGNIIKPKKKSTTLEQSRKTLIMKDEAGNTIKFIDPESGALEAVRNRGTIYFKTSNEMAAVFVILGEVGGKVTDGEGNPWSLGIHTLIAARNNDDYRFLKRVYENSKNKLPH